MKFADETAVVGLIAHNDESLYRQEVEGLVVWCRANSLYIRVKKMKEMVVDYRKRGYTPSPLFI